MLSAPVEQSLDQPRLKVYQSWPAPLALALLGFVGLLVTTRWGLGVSPDSVVYIGAARNLLAGRGLTVPFGDSVDSPLTHYPPLYPVLLAALGGLGVEPMEAARWVNALLLGGNLMLVALALYHVRPRMKALPLAGAAAVLVSPSLFGLHLMAWTEALFIFVSFGGLLALAYYVETARWPYLVASGLLLAGAVLTRYAGLAGLTAAVLGLLLFGPGGLRQRVKAGTLLGMLGFAPTLAWAARNWLVADTVANRTLAFHPITGSHLRQALETVSAWLLIPGQAPGLVKLGGVLLVVAGLAAIYWPPARLAWVERLKHLPVLVKFLALFVGVYGLFLVGSISLLDANTPLDDRILSPLYVSGLVLALYGLGQLWERLARRLRLGLVVAGLVFGLLSVSVLAGRAAEAYTNGLGFNQRLWRESPTVAVVNGFPADTLIYSNAPEAVYLRTGRTALRLPRLIRLMDQQANSNYLVELAAMRGRLAAEAGVVVYFETVRGPSLPTAEALVADLELERIADAADGDVYALQP